MTFFSDGNNEYFSLILNPNKNNISYVYKLNKIQELTSRHFIQPLFIFSLFIFIVTIFIACAEFFKFNLILCENQELVVLALAVTSTVIAFLEVFFFLWIRNGQKNLTKYYEMKQHRVLLIMNKKSWMVYIIFLLNMQTPFIGILALPGGLPDFLNKISMYGSTFLFFLYQIIIFLIVLSIFLVKRIHFLFFEKNKINCSV